MCVTTKLCNDNTMPPRALPLNTTKPVQAPASASVVQQKQHRSRSRSLYGHSIHRVYRLYSKGWQTGKELLNGLQTVDKRRNNQRPSGQYAQPLLESKIYVARRTRIEAPARSTILRRVGLLEALSSAARGP